LIQEEGHNKLIPGVETDVGPAFDVDSLIQCPVVIGVDPDFLTIPALLSSEDIREGERRGANNIFQAEIFFFACLDCYLWI